MIHSFNHRTTQQAATEMRSSVDDFVPSRRRPPRIVADQLRCSDLCFALFVKGSAQGYVLFIFLGFVPRKGEDSLLLP